jgi:hypothetical protein
VGVFGVSSVKLSSQEPDDSVSTVTGPESDRGHNVQTSYSSTLPPKQWAPEFFPKG